MEYYFNRILKDTTFTEAIEKTMESLKSEGFGVLTDIDIKSTLKNKLDIDFRYYRILGACNPPLAHKALMAEDKIGTMLPCNIIIQEIGPETIEIAAIDPAASMQAVNNPGLKSIAEEVRNKLKKVIKNISQ